MKQITWLLVVVTLAFGCGRDKKAWAQKIDKLVQRVYACQDVACAKAVDEEMGKIIGGDEGRNLDEGEPEFMFGAGERIRNRVAELEADANVAKQRASAPVSALEIFETSVRACSLAYADLHAPVRAQVEATFAKVGATLPPDQVPKAKAPGGLFWHDAFVESFLAAMKDRVPLEDQVYAKVASDLCIVNYRYESTKAKDPTYFGVTVDNLESIMKALDRGAIVNDLVAAVRRAAPDDEVFALTKQSTQTIRAALGAK